jgi:L1 cell adhesion molecule like protein
MILGELKEQAEAHIGPNTRIRHAVIIVPAAFTIAQRKATVDAAAIAGLHVQRFLVGSTAAVLTYEFNRKSRMMLNDLGSLPEVARVYTTQNGGNSYAGKDQSGSTGRIFVLVVDFGGSSLDVTLAEIEDVFVRVKATAGYAYLGGGELDNCMRDVLVEDIQRRFRKDVTLSPRAMAKLKEACERAKCVLSTYESTKVKLEGLIDGVEDYERTITRTEFEGWCTGILSFVVKKVGQVLHNAQIKSEDVHDYILVGGTCRIPLVTRMLSDYFQGRESSKIIDVVEAGADAVRRAGIYAARISYKIDDDVLLFDVSPVSLGIKPPGGVTLTLLKRNAQFLATRSTKLWVEVDEQTSCFLSIYEGEQAPKNLLEQYKLSEFSCMPRSMAQRLD